MLVALPCAPEVGVIEVSVGAGRLVMATDTLFDVVVELALFTVILAVPIAVSRLAGTCAYSDCVVPNITFCVVSAVPFQ